MFIVAVIIDFNSFPLSSKGSTTVLSSSLIVPKRYVACTKEIFLSKKVGASLSCSLEKDVKPQRGIEKTVQWSGVSQSC